MEPGASVHLGQGPFLASTSRNTTLMFRLECRIHPRRRRATVTSPPWGTDRRATTPSLPTLFGKLLGPLTMTPAGQRPMQIGVTLLQEWRVSVPSNVLRKIVLEKLHILSWNSFIRIPARWPQAWTCLASPLRTETIGLRTLTWPLHLARVLLSQRRQTILVRGSNWVTDVVPFINSSFVIAICILLPLTWTRPRPLRKAALVKLGRVEFVL